MHYWLSSCQCSWYCIIVLHYFEISFKPWYRSHLL